MKRLEEVTRHVTFRRGIIVVATARHVASSRECSNTTPTSCKVPLSGTLVSLGKEQSI